MKFWVIFILILSLQTTSSFATVSLNPPMVTTNKVKESVSTNVETCKAESSTSSNTFLKILSVTSVILGTLTLMVISAADENYSDNQKAGSMMIGGSLIFGGAVGIAKSF